MLLAQAKAGTGSTQRARRAGSGQDRQKSGHRKLPAELVPLLGSFEGATDRLGALPAPIEQKACAG